MDYLDTKNAFKNYLFVEKRLSAVSIKNYLSDFDSFWQWLSHQFSPIIISPLLLIEKITPQILSAYKLHLQSVNMAKTTTKRHLATISVFCQFCLKQQWLKKNPFFDLADFHKEGESKETNKLLSSFGSYLKNEGFSKNTVKNYVADIRQFVISCQ